MRWPLRALGVRWRVREKSLHCRVAVSGFCACWASNQSNSEGQPTARSNAPQQILTVGWYTSSEQLWFWAHSQDCTTTCPAFLQLLTTSTHPLNLTLLPHSFYLGAAPHFRVDCVPVIVRKTGIDLLRCRLWTRRRDHGCRLCWERFDVSPDKFEEAVRGGSGRPCCRLHNPTLDKRKKMHGWFILDFNFTKVVAMNVWVIASWIMHGTVSHTFQFVFLMFVFVIF